MTIITKPFTDVQILGATQRGPGADTMSRTISPVVPNPIPPTPEEDEMKDIAYTEGYSLTESFAVPPIDGLFIEDLGGTWNIAGDDPNDPYCWTAAENGVYRILILEKLICLGGNFNSTAPNFFNVSWDFYGNWDGTVGSFGDTASSYVIPQGYPDTWYDQRSYLKYYKMQAGQRLQPVCKIDYVSSAAGVDPTVSLYQPTTFEIAKVGDYTP